MKKMTEGRKMFFSVMAIFLTYAVIFLVFEDYDRRVLNPLSETSDWYLLVFSVAVMTMLSALLYRYSRHMDERISREQEEQRNHMRRQLTNNIAHELKTPVASILGYMETLIENPNISAETQQRFIERSHAQACRLTSLLQDISTLNKIDYAPDALAMEPVNIADMVDDIRTETALALEKRKMKFVNWLPRQLTICGNPSLLYGIFRNLTDNAINYAGANTTITLTAEQMAEGWLFHFCDNGVGVAKEHLPRLFERFYRVDKGRSRKMGGTGLGLAIVKNAVLLHDGTISAVVPQSGGLRFDFTLKNQKPTPTTTPAPTSS